MSEAYAYNPQEPTPEVVQQHIEDGTWQTISNCRNKDPNLFFPNNDKGVRLAQSICRSCVVQEHCLEYALSEQIDHGVWGGASEKDRRRLQRGRPL